MGFFVVKIDAKKLLVVEDQYLEDTSIDAIVEELPETSPRFICLNHMYTTKDGRTSLPMVFIYCSPPNVTTSMNVLYASSKSVVVMAAEIGKVSTTLSLLSPYQSTLRSPLHHFIPTTFMDS